MTEGSLAGKVAVVTGASRGIGRAVAQELASLGAQVVVTARTVEPRHDIAGTIGDTVALIEAAGGSAVAMAADLLVADDLAQLASDVRGRFGRCDIVVNNAAYIGDAVFESFWDMSGEDFRAMMELNVNVPWALTKAFGDDLRASGGIVVNMSSGAGLPPEGAIPRPIPGTGGLGSAYPTSKAALNQLTFTLGNELHAAGVTMVAVDPGFARSESAELMSERIGIDPAMAQPVEIAAKAVGHIVTSPSPLEWAGRFVVAAELVAQQ